MRRQLGRFDHDGAVGVDDAVAGRGRLGDDRAQQLDAVGIGPRRIGVGEVIAEVAEAGSAEHRIGERVRDRVGVAVPGQPAGVGNAHTAEDQRPRRLRRERVHVDALTHPHGTST